jgi:hypothetical protein
VTVAIEEVMSKDVASCRVVLLVGTRTVFARSPEGLMAKKQHQKKRPLKREWDDVITRATEQ